MNHYVSWITFVILGLTLSLVPTANACMCGAELIHTKYCNSDFVAVVTLNEFTTLSESEANYKITINEIIKATLEAKKALEDSQLLWTIPTGGMCGMILNKGETWIVGGSMKKGRPSVFTCDLNLKWTDLSEKKREALRLVPELGCLPKSD